MRRLLFFCLLVGVVLASPLLADSYIVTPPESGNSEVVGALSEVTTCPQCNQSGLKGIYGTSSGSGELSEDCVECLKGLGWIVQPNFRIKAFLNDSVAQINATELWDISVNDQNLNGTGQTVCVIDSGIDYNHSAFGGAWGEVVIAGHMFLNDGNDTQECNATNHTACYDGFGHGTNVAGIIASRDGMYVGVAPSSKLVVVKAISDENIGHISDLVSGINYCVENAAVHNITVISLSLGTDNYENSTYCDADFLELTSAIDNATAHNISVVAASGNGENATAIPSPACIQSVTPVGGVTKAGAVQYNYWSLPILFAPGVSITSTNNTGGFSTGSGTSFAAPHVAAVFAIMRQYLNLSSQSKTPQQLEDIAIATGHNVTSNQNNTLIDALGLYQNISDTVAPNVTIISPTDTTYNRTSVALNYTVNESGSGTDTCKYSLNGGANQTLADCNNTTISNLSTGNYSLVLYVNDSAGNLGSDAVNFSVSLPTFSINLSSPANGSYLSNTTPTFNFTVRGSEANYFCELFVNDTGYGTNLSVQNNTETTIVANTTISEGAYLCHINCTSLDVTNSSATNTLTIDSTAPEVNITYPIENATLYAQTITVNVSVTETNINFTNVSIINSSDSVVNSTTNTSNGTISVSFTVDANQTYSISAMAYDLAGNNGSASTLNVTLSSSAVLKIRPNWTSTYYTENQNLSAGEPESQNTTRGLYVNLNQTKDLYFVVNNSGLQVLQNLTAVSGGFSGLDVNLSWTEGADISEARNISASASENLRLAVVAPNTIGNYSGYIYLNSSNGNPNSKINLSLTIEVTNRTLVRLNQTSNEYYIDSEETTPIGFSVYFYDNTTRDTFWNSSQNLRLVNSTDGFNLTFTYASGAFSSAINTSGLSEGNYTLLGNLTDLSENTGEANEIIGLLNNIALSANASPNENLIVKGTNFVLGVNLSKEGSVAVGNATVCLDLPSGLENVSEPLCRNVANMTGDSSQLINWTLRGTSRGTHTINISAYSEDGRFNETLQKSLVVRYGELELDWRYSSDDPPSSVDVDDQFYVKVDVENVGNLNASDVELKLEYDEDYFELVDSTDDSDTCDVGTLSAGGTDDDCWWKLSAESSGSDKEITVSIDSSYNATGSEYITREVDIESSSDSSSSGGSTSGSDYDLTFYKPTVSTFEMFQGGTYALAINIKNTGDDALNDVYIDITGISDSYWELDETSHSDLSSGSTRTYTAYFTLPADFDARSYPLKINAISDEDSWSRSITLVVKGILLEYNGLENASVVPGGFVEMPFSVENVGEKDLKNLRASLEGLEAGSYLLNPNQTSSLAMGETQNYTLSISFPENVSIGSKALSMKIISNERTFTHDFSVNVLPSEEEKSNIEEDFQNLSESFASFLERYEKLNLEGVNASDIGAQVNQTQQKMAEIEEHLKNENYAEATLLMEEVSASLNSLESSVLGTESRSSPMSIFTVLVLGFAVVIVLLVGYYAFVPKSGGMSKGGYIPGKGYVMGQEKKSSRGIDLGKFLKRFSGKSEHDVERERKLDEWRKSYERSKKERSYGF